jgi:hypothetical protein
MNDPLARQLHKLIAETDDALVARWLQRLCDGEGSSADPRRPPPPDVLDPSLNGSTANERKEP